MNLRWLWLDHFPSGLELTEAQRREARRRAREHRRRDVKYRGSLMRMRRLTLLFALPLSVLFTVWIVLLPLLRLPTAGFVMANLSGIALFNLLLWTAIAYGLHSSSVPYVRKALCDMGLPVCIDCGYILRGLDTVETRCPECGTTLESTLPAA